MSQVSKNGTKSKLGFSLSCPVFQIILKLKAPDQPQSIGEESLLAPDITVTCATLCVTFSSKLKAINVFPKHILKSKARDQSNQVRKK